MFSWLKKHFIPHRGNDHRPHILRDENIRNIAAIVIFLEIFTFLIPTLAHINTTDNMAAVLPAVLSALTNTERKAQNLDTLTVNPILNKAAEMKAKDMAMHGYFAHTSPDGKTPWYWLAQAGYKYQYAGENLAVNFSDSKDVTNAWMASPTHKANIVKGKYTEVGTGVANGIYEGREAIFVAQVYANPLPKILPNTQPKPVEVKTINPIASTVQEEANVLGVETSVNTVAEPTFLQKLLASPHNTTNVILYVVFGIIALALLLYVVIKMRGHHRDLIDNALILLVIIGAIFLANYYYSYRGMLIAEDLNYSNEGK